MSSAAPAVSVNSLNQPVNSEGKPTDAHGWTVNTLGTPTDSVGRTINAATQTLDSNGIPLTSSMTQPNQASSTTSRQSSSITTTPKPTTNSNGTTTSGAQPTMTPHDSRLANGTVAGIVIGASIGLALITFLVTFLLMRRKKTTGQSKSIPAPAGASRNEKGFSSHPYEVSEASSSAIPSFLPQAADDRTVQTKAKTLLDQIELYVENFYQDSPKSGSKVASADLTAFNSPFLENALSTLLSQATRSTPFIKHGLAYFITTSLLPMENSDATLLPEEFITLPRALKRTRNSSSQKPGYLQAISQWRVLTAYLRPDSASDQAYIVQRDRQIDNICQNFLFAFAQWSSPRHGDDERVGSLVAILKDAANLGIFLQSQPVDLQFQFPTQAEVGTGKICIAPALVKTTDEKAQVLSKPQVLVNAGYQKV